MTTPPTPAGWYPDPDGTGGQRYWDGMAWTEHRSPAVEAPQPAAEPAAPAGPAVSEQPTAVVPTITPPSGPVGGAHRRADADAAADVPAQVTEPTARFETPGSFEAPSSGEPTATFEPTSRFETPTFEPSATPSELPPAPYSDGGAVPAGGDDRKKALTLFAGLTGALLLVLIAAVVYGVFFNKSNNVDASASGGSSTSESTKATSSTGGSVGESTARSSATETPVQAGDAVDGPLSFTIHGIEVGSTVVMSDAPVQKDAVGEYNVVHMTVTNNGTDPTAFIAQYQKLNANGQVYTVDDQATAYLEGTFADLQPGQSADVSIAFDVPPGTKAESVELHTDPTTPGVVVPFE